MTYEQMPEEWQEWLIAALVEGHYHALQDEPTPVRIVFWLREARTPERLHDLARQFSAETHALQPARSLLSHALRGDLEDLRTALDIEARAEQARARASWEPLRRELEEFRRQQRAALGQAPPAG